MTDRPAPLSELRVPDLAGVLTDIDDTLTTEGRLTAAAYAALERAHDAGLVVVAVTGRPAGWADHIARMWPLSGVVAENGALYMRYAGGQMVERTVLDDPAELRAHRKKLDDVAREILTEVPGTALASDQPYRVFDLAIDYCEDVPRLAPEDVARIVEIFESHGATTKVSSIHVNGWFGDYDKLGMLRRLLAQQLDFDLDDEATRRRFVYAGDSPNDQPLFAFFENSVGMANIDDFKDAWTTWPAYRTTARAGNGFVELINHLLRQARQPAT